MTIATYTDLQTSIGNWLHRSDLATIIPDFITLAEERLTRDLRARSMEKRAIALTIASNAYLGLPGDVEEVRRLIVTSTDPKLLLKYKTPDEIQRIWPNATTGQPVHFTIIGNEIQFGPIPDLAYTLELTYRQSIPALSNASPTNWLITAYPDIYLAACMLSAQGYIKDDTSLASWHNLYQDGIDSINKVDWYTGSTMAVSHD